MRDESRVPLFRFDPGWPFVVAGLLLLAAGILIPGHRELLELRGELVRQETVEQVTFEQLRAYDEFLAGVRESDPEVIRRLAMAHLNKIPAGEESLLLTPGMNQTVGEWVQSSIPDRTVVVPPYPDTVLARWALGPGRLWMIGMAVTLLFVGFVIGPSTPGIPGVGAITTRRRVRADEPPVESGIGCADECLEGTPEIAEAEAIGRTGVPDEVEEPEPAVVHDGVPDGVERGGGDDDSVPTSGLGRVDSTEPSWSADGTSTREELRADELELWRASGTGGDWTADEYVGLLPPEESVASCDDVGLAFIDRCDGVIDATPDRGAD